MTKNLLIFYICITIGLILTTIQQIYAEENLTKTQEASISNNPHKDSEKGLNYILKRKDMLRYHTQFVKMKDCDENSKAAPTDKCYLTKAQRNLDSNYCLEIPSKIGRKHCYHKMAEILLDVNLCEKLKDNSFEYEDCVNNYSKILKIIQEYQKDRAKDAKEKTYRWYMANEYTQNPDKNISATFAIMSLAKAAESYSENNNNRYPITAKELTSPEFQSLGEKYCNKSVKGYSFSCQLSEDGYRFKATPVNDKDPKSYTQLIITGEILISSDDTIRH